MYKYYLSILLLLFSINLEIKGAVSFKVAQPVWAESREEEKNLTLGFVAAFENNSQQTAYVKVTGSTVYRLFLNGQFIGYGPARAAHDYYRVDEWDISDNLNIGNNVLAIEVASYNVNSYYTLDQPAFVQAEVIVGERVQVATGSTNVSISDFTTILLNNRVQKVPRYSFQRPFMECYDLKGGYNNWLYGEQSSNKTLVSKRLPSKKLLRRNVSYPKFNKISPVSIIANGTVSTDNKREQYWKDRSLVNIGEKLKGYKEDELTCNPSIDVQEISVISIDDVNIPFIQDKYIKLETNQFATYSFLKNISGFIGSELNMSRSGTVYFIFDEMLTDGDIKFNRISATNVISYHLKPGNYKLESFEPYTLQHLKVLMREGEGEIKNIYVREYANPDVKSSFSSSDTLLNKVYQSAVDSYRQSSIDIFMDCPSRERAGWLCDSYFMGRAAMAISGNTIVEKNFIENYMLPESFENIPRGMLPMCYPADHYDGQFIPNWAMWFVLELYEYYKRSNDKEMVDNLKLRVSELISYFDKYKNEDGLLEKLPGWKFVEWSDANKYVNDVNYPTNMLYASMLDASADLYNWKDLKNEATKIRKTIREQSFNGLYFVDNAIRDEAGQLNLTENISEVCQYYAFYFDVASLEEYPDLWKKIVASFGPDKFAPNIEKPSMLMGIPLRLLLLTKNGLISQFLDETKSYLGYMAEQTGTLWEHSLPNASLNHGYPSFVIDEIHKNILGVYDINDENKTITIKVPDIDIGIDSCKGVVPFDDKIIVCEWRKSKEGINISYKLPDGYRAVVIDNKKKNY